MDIIRIYSIQGIDIQDNKSEFQAFNICLDSEIALKLLGRKISREEKEEVKKNGLQKIINEGLISANRDISTLSPYLYVNDKSSPTALLDTCRFESTNVTILPLDLKVLKNNSGKFLIRYGAYKVRTEQEIQRLVTLFHNWLEYFSERR